jgi:hypothetical protein
LEKLKLTSNVYYSHSIVQQTLPSGIVFVFISISFTSSHHFTETAGDSDGERLQQQLNGFQFVSSSLLVETAELTFHFLE